MPDYELIAPPEAALHAVCSACGHPLGTEDEALPSDPTPVTAPAPALATVPASHLAAGALLAGRCRIVDILGSGGAGEVYRAQDLTLNQTVALKLFPDFNQGDGNLENLRREVLLARKISHGNVCRVFDIGEFVSGEDLHKLLHRIGRLSPDKALQVSRQLCAGLAAHEAGVLHRDLKPANNAGPAAMSASQISGSPYWPGTLTSLTQAPPGYMAPEQLAGQEVTVRSDIYTLGLVLNELFTGKRAVDPRSASDLVRGRVRPTPVVSMPGVHPLIQQVIARCLESNPSRRPASVAQVAAVLSRAARLGAAVVSQRVPAPQVAAHTQDSTVPRLAWSLLGSLLAGIALMLLLAPQLTDIGLAFGTKGPDASLGQAFTWLWCLALQSFLALAAMAFLLRSL